MNSWSLTFRECVDYSRFDEITVDIWLISSTSFVELDAKVDTGSRFCIFQPSIAEKLELDLLSGVPKRMRTAAGSFPAYGHEITLVVYNLEWQIMVFFAEPEEFPVNVVGRIGFLDHLRVGLIDYEQLLYLDSYEAA